MRICLAWTRRDTETGDGLPIIAWVEHLAVHCEHLGKRRKPWLSSCDRHALLSDVLLDSKTSALSECIWRCRFVPLPPGDVSVDRNYLSEGATRSAITASRLTARAIACFMSGIFSDVLVWVSASASASASGPSVCNHMFGFSWDRVLGSADAPTPARRFIP